MLNKSTQLLRSRSRHENSNHQLVALDSAPREGGEGSGASAVTTRVVRSDNPSPK